MSCARNCGRCDGAGDRPGTLGQWWRWRWNTRAIPDHPGISELCAPLPASRVIGDTLALGITFPHGHAVLVASLRGSAA